MGGAIAPVNALHGLTINHLVALAPLVAEHLEVRNALNILKASLAVYMTDVRGLSAAEAASQLGMSTSWVYTQLKRHEKKQSLKDIQRPIRQHVLNFFLNQSPRSQTIAECGEYLESKNLVVSDTKLTNLVAVFCNLGYLEKDGTRYRWKQGTLWHDAGLLTDRAERVSDALPVLMALMNRHVQEDNGLFSHIHIRITPQAFAHMTERIRQAVRQSVAEAIQMSLEAHPEGCHPDDVEVDGIVLYGSAPVNPTKEN